MKFPIVSVFLPVLFLIAGCDDKARSLASQASIVLEQRSLKLSSAIAPETQAYNDYVVQWVKNDRDLMNDALANERSERVNELSADYQEQRKPASLWRKDLSDYAQADYAARRNLLTSDINANTLYLQRFESLKADQDKVDTLAKLLSALANKPSLRSDLTVMANFAEETKKSFDDKVCADLKAKGEAGNSAAQKLLKDKGCEQGSK